MCHLVVECKQDYQQGICWANVNVALKFVFAITVYDNICVYNSGQSSKNSNMLNKNILCIQAGCQ